MFSPQDRLHPKECLPRPFHRLLRSVASSNSSLLPTNFVVARIVHLDIPCLLQDLQRPSFHLHSKGSVNVAQKVHKASHTIHPHYRYLRPFLVLSFLVFDRGCNLRQTSGMEGCIFDSGFDVGPPFFCFSGFVLGALLTVF